MITKFQIRRMLSIASILVLASVLQHVLLQRQMVSAETVTRLMGMLKGILLIFCANDVPKRLPPLEHLYSDPAHDLACRRIMGWLGAAVGLGVTLVYALAPLPIIRTVVICLLVIIIAVVAGMMMPIVWKRFSNRRSAS